MLSSQVLSKDVAFKKQLHSGEYQDILTVYNPFQGTFHPAVKEPTEHPLQRQLKKKLSKAERGKKIKNEHVFITASDYAITKNSKFFQDIQKLLKLENSEFVQKYKEVELI